MSVRRWSGLLILPLGVEAYLIVLTVMVRTGNATLFPSLLLIGGATVPLSVLLFAHNVGRRPEGHTGLVALTAIAGAFIGTTAAGVLEYDVLRRLGALEMVGVGFIEEATKLIVPLVIFLVAHRRTSRMGAVIGIASGMGFAVLETMGYGFNALLAKGGNIASVEQTDHLPRV